MTIPDYMMKDILCFDTETAVLGDRICEVGFSLFRNGQLVHEWGMFINPTVPIDSEASNVHKIYDSDVENSPTFNQIGWWTYNILNSADIHVAYNYEYDRRVFENEFARISCHFPLKPMIDPFIFFKQYNKYNKGKTLIKATEKYGIPYIGAHRAMNDSTATGKLIFKMAATKVNFPKTLSSMLDKQRFWVQVQFEDFAKYLANKGKPPPDKPNYGYYEV